MAGGCNSVRQLGNGRACEMRITRFLHNPNFHPMTLQLDRTCVKGIPIFDKYLARTRALNVAATKKLEQSWIAKIRMKI